MQDLKDEHNLAKQEKLEYEKAAVSKTTEDTYALFFLPRIIWSIYA